MNKKFLKKYIFVLFSLTIFLSSCSSKSSLGIENVRGKYFATKDSIIVVADEKISSKYEEAKVNDLVIYDINKPENSKLYKNCKIEKMDSRNYLKADDLDKQLEVLDDKSIKDVKNDLIYKEYKIGDDTLKLDYLNKEISNDEKNIANKSYFDKNGNAFIYQVSNGSKTIILKNSDGTEKSFTNAKLENKDGKIYLVANGFDKKIVYSNMNKLVDENTNEEYKLNINN